MPKNKKTTILAIAVLAVAAVVMLACWFAFKPETNTGVKNLTILVTHGDGSTKNFAITTEAAYLGEALVAEGLVQGEKKDFGLYVTAVDGETIDEEIQQWWGYTKRGETVNYGVDMCPIADGEQYEFTLNTGW